MKKIILLSSILCAQLSSTLYAYEDNLDKLLKKSLSQGTRNKIALTVFNYKEVKNDPLVKLIYDDISKTDPSTLKSPEDKRAFWINAYNVATIKLILDNYPVKSINDISTDKIPVWKKSAITINGTSYSLDHIDYKILQKMNDPRVHFAIVCAALSCPDLRNEAYRASKLDSQLNDQAKRFFTNKSKGAELNLKTNTLHVSMIMDWFKKDFQTAETIPLYVKPFLKNSISKNITKSTHVKFMNYDWQLNE